MKPEKKIIFIGILGVFIILFFSWNVALNSHVERITIGDNEFVVEIVSTNESRKTGLSEHTFLSEGDGMLFIFEESGLHPFWMKDMDFAIDILWIDKNNEIVYIVPNVTPDTFPESFVSKKDALYVLEIISGSVQKRNINIGDKVMFQDR